MTEKQLLIQAFQSLDFEKLHYLLDDNKSYMDVSKDLFLSRLKEKINQYSDLKSYEEVIEGICDFCNKGCKAYKFKAEGCPSLSLFFEEKNDAVTDIYLCNSLLLERSDEDSWPIYFEFYEEEKVDFKPSIDYLINLQRIEKAIEDFNRLVSMNLVPIEEVVHWHNKCKTLANDLNLDDISVSSRYKAYEYIDLLYSKVSSLVHNYNNNHLAQNALDAYNKIDANDEKSIVKWLIDNKEISIFSSKKTDNWKKTGFIILETEPNLVIDCVDYLAVFLFDDIYDSHKNEMMAKYEPTEAHFEENGGTVECSLENYLKLHNKYLDLL